MNLELIKKWEENKYKLEEYFKTTQQSEFRSYKSIVQKLIELVINDEDESYDSEDITVVDHGDYQGTQLFLIHKDTYQPSVGDYLITHTYYGSCSGCDTLQSISEYDGGIPSDEQVKDYMMLALHLIQKMKNLYEN